jgi:propanediol dehydratase small subunit
MERAQLRDELAEAVPSSGELAERRADEILKMYDLLRERGEAEKSDLLGVVDVEATEYASAASVWSNMVKGRETLRALPGVETPPEGKTTWKYTDE